MLFAREAVHGDEVQGIVLSVSILLPPTDSRSGLDDRETWRCLVLISVGMWEGKKA